MIRKAKITDLGAINTIFNQAVEARHQTAALNPITTEQRLQWYKDHDVDNYPLFVLEVDYQVIGWLSISKYRRGREALRQVAEVSYYLHKDFQGQGYGTKLVDHAVKIAPEFGFRVLVAILLGHNERSIRLLQKFNFEEWGNLPKTVLIDSELYDHCIYGLRL